jgi:hypothetical protein
MAFVAQLVGQRLCTASVPGSNPGEGSIPLEEQFLAAGYGAGKTCALTEAEVNQRLLAVYQHVRRLVARQRRQRMTQRLLQRRRLLGHRP